MLKLAILDDYTRTAQKNANWSPLKEKVEITSFDRHLSEEEAKLALKPFDIICTMRERTLFPRTLFASLPNLKLVTTIAARLVGLDMAAATEHGVLVCHDDLPRSNPKIVSATPELAWGLMIATVRHIIQENQNIRQGGWQYTIGDFILRGRTLGVLGLGRVGKLIAKYGLAFDMNVIAWSPSLTAEAAVELGARRVEKDDLFKESDVLIICAALNDRSRGTVTARELGLMKPTAYLINPSRGPIVDEAALIAVLRDRRIAGAGLDVFDQEPMPKDHPFRTMDNVVATPHLGYNVNEAMHYWYTDTIETVQAFVNGSPIRIANPEALPKVTS